MTRLLVPERETAQNSRSSGDQQTSSHELSAAEVRDVQVIPSELVMTRLPVPLFETAQNSCNSGDQQTDCQLLVDAGLREVQVIPSGLVMTRLELVCATAQNSRSSGDQQTDCQPMVAEVRCVQNVPLELVMTPLLEIAANSRNSGDQQTDRQTLSAVEVRAYHCRPVPSHGVPPHPRAAGRVTLDCSSTEPCHESPHALAFASAGVNDCCGQE